MLIIPYINEHPVYKEHRILERLCEPDRIIIFRVCWLDDNNNVRVNRGYRVQFNNAIGPYKGGLRFHPSVSLSILKFLGFEQTFKNSLTTLPMGGAKGGADFNPKGKSDAEVMRFCHSFMIELSRHIGKDKDIPAGDIGVGAREIGYLFGQYKRLNNEFTGAITGKDITYGGSLIRPEATGYGNVYFMREMLKNIGQGFENKSIVISGSGNVAQYAAEKAIQFGGKVITLSDSSGFIHDKDGIDEEKLAYIKDLKNVKRGRISEYAEKYSAAEYFPKKRPWSVPCEIALPCATQNELNGEEAVELVKNGVIAVGEGANMPSTLEAIHYFHRNNVLFSPGKASNAGGVTVSGLEQTQNSQRINWTREEVDLKLQEIMVNIHDKCLQYGQEKSHVNYVKGANIAGFVKVADAMVAQGVF